MAKDKKLWIDMCAGSELKDTQGETLSVDGANIDDLQYGKGRFNDNHGKGFFNSLGRVTEAKKIMKSEDCENERQKYYWEKIKAPFVYAKGYLYNDEEHPNAKAAAAILRNIHREDSPLRMKASVEGGVLSRGMKDPTRLARTKIHSVALTFTPANNATLVEPLNVDKSSTDWEADKQLIKSVAHLAETDIPSFRHIQRHASANTIYENINKIQELAMSVGVEIMIKDIDPTTIMEKAVLNKVSTNITKINHLVKAVSLANVMKPTDTAAKPAATSPGKVAMASADKKQVKDKANDNFQQGVSKLKNESSVPKTPVSGVNTPNDTMKVQSAKSVKHTNTLKGHASKAMKDPEHIKIVHSSLLERGVDPAKAKAIVSKIQSHMQTDIKKSDDEIEKGDLGRAAKNLVLAGALATGAGVMSPKDEPKSVKAPISQERKIAAHNAKIDDPDKMISPKGYDERKPNAKKEFMAARKKKKEKLKKALMAGYGGAGAPTNLTNGGVFQAEKVEDGRKTKKADADEFQYISCDECGHEQVYMQHQVKCRKCRKNFNLKKLEGLM